MGKRGNVQNLVQNSKNLTAEERRISAQRAGKASAKARRAKRQMQDIAKIVLSMPYECGDTDDLEGIAFEDYPDRSLTVGERAVLAAARKALRGDINALTFLRDTAGEKPVEKIEVGADIEEAEREVAALIAKKRASDG